MVDRSLRTGLEDNPGPDLAAEISHEMKMESARKELNRTLKARLEREVLRTLAPNQPKTSPERSTMQLPRTLSPGAPSDCGI